MALIKAWRLKEGGAYFKIREIIQMKFQNFVKWYTASCISQLLVIFIFFLFVYLAHMHFNPIKPGRGGVIFARSKLKLKLFLNDTLWLFLTFTRDYFCWKKNWQNIKFSGGNIFLYRAYCQKIGGRICRNSFSRRNKYVHV